MRSTIEHRLGSDLIDKQEKGQSNEHGQPGQFDQCFYGLHFAILTFLMQKG
jgi:hypothetical protein